MTLILDETGWKELFQQFPGSCPPDLILDDFETVESFPACLGRGYTRSMELLPGMWLDMFDRTLHQDWIFRSSVCDHAVQYSVLLTGFIHHEDTYPTLGGQRSYVSGSGISPSYTAKYERSQRLAGVSIHLLPAVLEEFLMGMPDSPRSLLKVLLKHDDWKVSFFPSVTLAMQQVTQQILQTSLRGSIRRLYLQAKAFDLLALQLQPIVSDQRLSQSLPGRKPETIARIYHAKDILTSRLDNPPSLLELAWQVGVSDRTLRRGFREVFGTTVVGYLMQQRMNQAEQLLREGNCTVAEVANRVGYAHLGHFAAGFKRQFGITPSECLMGKLSKQWLDSVAD